MHEFSITTDIVEKVLEFVEQEKIGRVLEVHLAIGEFMCVQEDQLRFCYESITKETPIEGSELSVEKVTAIVRCPYCDYVGAPTYWDALKESSIATLQCPQCGKAATAIQGRDCTINSIRYAAQD